MLCISDYKLIIVDNCEKNRLEKDNLTWNIIAVCEEKTIAQEIIYIYTIVYINK